MKNNTGIANTTLKWIVGIVLVALAFNLTMFVHQDKGTLTLNTLKAYAQTGGTNYEEEETSQATFIVKGCVSYNDEGIVIGNGNSCDRGSDNCTPNACTEHHQH